MSAGSLRPILARVAARGARLVADPIFNRRFRHVALAVSVVYLLVALTIGIRALSGMDWLAYGHAFLIGLALYGGSLIAQSGAWALTVTAFRRGSPGPQWADFAIYASSHFMKRLPGGFWHIAGRVAAYRDRGIGAKVAVGASVVETALVAAVAAEVAASFGPLAVATGRPGILWAVLLVVGTGIGVGCISGRRRENRGVPAGRLGWLWGARQDVATYVVVAALYLLAVVIGGIILLQFLGAHGGNSLTLDRAISIWALTAAISYVAVILPVGLTIREVTLTVILSGVIAPPAPIVIAILFRLLFTVGDLIWGPGLILVARQAALATSAASSDTHIV